jgi:hypothetical protein
MLLGDARRNCTCSLDRLRTQKSARPLAKTWGHHSHDSGLQHELAESGIPRDHLPAFSSVSGTLSQGMKT